MNKQDERDNAEIESLSSLNTVPVYTMTLAAAVHPYALTAVAEPWWAILVGAGGLLCAAWWQTRRKQATGLMDSPKTFAYRTPGLIVAAIAALHAASMAMEALTLTG